MIVYLPYDLGNVYCDYRCYNHKLPAEQGVERNDCICDLCNLCEFGDFLDLFKCTFYFK